MSILTAGSCFAQHLHKTLLQLNWNVITKESAPTGMPKRIADRYAFGQYSARYGNIYTARQWVELIEEAVSDVPVSPLVWQREGRFFDALRPSVEPKGLQNSDEVTQARDAHISAVREALREADCAIFTLGLTEAWIDQQSGRTLPTAPGTVAGTLTEAPASFVNFGYHDVVQDLKKARGLLRDINPKMQTLLTVSPVPLTATATDKHVVQASTVSKAVLRAAAEAMTTEFEDVDYFPSFEIITTPVLGGPFFEANLRSPKKEGVERVMQVFVDSYVNGHSDGKVERPAHADQTDTWDVQCEDMLLDAFAK
ncbi:MAG: GSCFA domain-containing protein [Pseudomonadota bacterium]